MEGGHSTSVVTTASVAVPVIYTFGSMIATLTFEHPASLLAVRLEPLALVGGFFF